MSQILHFLSKTFFTQDGEGYMGDDFASVDTIFDDIEKRFSAMQDTQAGRVFDNSSLFDAETVAKIAM